MNEIILGDCIEELRKLEENSIDMIVTSPPYNKSINNKHKIPLAGHRTCGVHYDKYSDDMLFEQYNEYQKLFINECYRVLKNGGTMFYNNKVAYCKNLYKNSCWHPYSIIDGSEFVLRQEIIWNKSTLNCPFGNRFHQKTERIYWLTKGHTEYIESKHAILSDIWNITPRCECADHPAPFPIEIPLRCIISIFNGDYKDKIVLDPYSGSGTTLVAAKLLGCNYLGIELSENYKIMAENRLNAFLKENPRLIEELEKHKVGNTHKDVVDRIAEKNRPSKMNMLF